MRQSKGLEVLVGVLLMAALACAVFAIQAGNQATRHLGPRSLQQAANGDIWLYQDDELLIASSQGELRQRVSLQPLALPGPVNSMVPLPSQDGEPRMLVAAIKSPEWLVMDGAGRVVGRLRPSGIEVPVRDTFHLATDGEGRIAMGTAGDHRVLLFDSEGRFLAQSAAGLFRYANGLWFEDGRWWVTDTNHGQVRGLDGHSLAPVAAVAIPAVGAASFPALGRQGGAPGHMIVGTMENDMERGRVIEVSAGGGLVREFRSRATDSKPTDFLWLDEGLLLAERDNFSLQLFDRQGNYRRDWGDGQVGAVLAAALEQRRQWLLLLRLAQGAAILFGVVAIGTYLAMKGGKAVGQVAATDPRFSRLATPSLPPGDEILLILRLHWLSIAVVTGALLFVQFALPGLAALAGILRPAGALSPGLLVILAVVGLLPIVSLVVLTPLMARHLAERMAEPRFEAALASRWVRWFRNSVVALGELEDDERVLEILSVTTTLLFPAFNRQIWVLTDHRLLVFAVDAGGAARLLEALPRAGLRARVEAASGWFARLGGQLRMSLQVPDGRAFCGYPGSPVTARRLADFLQLRVAPGVSAARRTEPSADRRSLEPRAAFLLSLVLPGLAQFLQGRFVPGLVLLSGMLIMIAALVTPVLLGWIGHFYDVSLGIGLSSLVLPAVWAVFAAQDAGHFARLARGG